MAVVRTRKARCELHLFTKPWGEEAINSRKREYQICSGWLVVKEPGAPSNIILTRAIPTG